MFRFNLTRLACVAAMAAIVGCQPGGDTDVGAVPASGTVTYNGSPVAGATVVFAPTGGGGKTAAGTTDAQGHFDLTTVESGDGAVPGTYAVTITKTEGGSSDQVQSEEDAYNSAFPGDGKEAAPAEVKDALPARYKSVDTSGLTATVDAGGGKEFKFDLTDDGAPASTEEAPASTE